MLTVLVSKGVGLAMAKPQTPKDGTGAWNAWTLKPALSMVLTMHQNDFGAASGEVHWTLTHDVSLSRLRSSP